MLDGWLNSSPHSTFVHKIQGHPLPLRLLSCVHDLTLLSRCWSSSRFYDAIITDPPYNIKEDAVVTNNRVRRIKASNATLAGHAEASGSSATPVNSAVEGGTDQAKVRHVPGCVDVVSGWDTGAGARAVANANDLVGEMIWALLSLARYSLKANGRLCFFLPLRGEEARADILPSALVDKLGEVDAHGKQLSLVYTIKQHMTSPNMCRWLLVLQKQPGRTNDMGG